MSGDQHESHEATLSASSQQQPTPHPTPPTRAQHNTTPQSRSPSATRSKLAGSSRLCTVAFGGQQSRSTLPAKSTCAVYCTTMMRARMARRRPLRSQRRSGARLVLGAILAACVLILGSPTVSAAAGSSSSSKSKQRTSQRASESGFPTCQAQRGLAFSSGAVPMELNMALPVCGSFSHNTCCNTNNIMPVLR
jgi:hypothetical protein